LNPKLLLIALLTICSRSHAQSPLDSLFNQIDPQKWSVAVEKKLGRLEAFFRKQNFLRKINLQSLLDFLSYEQVPQNKTHHFLVAYNFT
jgi:hypothetical protein